MVENPSRISVGNAETQQRFIATSANWERRDCAATLKTDSQLSETAFDWLSSTCSSQSSGPRRGPLFGPIHVHPSESW